MLVIHASIKVNPSDRDKFLELSKEVIKKSQEEEGNISYQLYENTSEDNLFVMLEEWRSIEALGFHSETPHFKTFIEQTQDMLLEPLKVKRFEVTQL